MKFEVLSNVNGILSVNVDISRSDLKSALQHHFSKYPDMAVIMVMTHEGNEVMDAYRNNYT